MRDQLEMSREFNSTQRDPGIEGSFYTGIRGQSSSGAWIPSGGLENLGAENADLQELEPPNPLALNLRPRRDHGGYRWGKRSGGFMALSTSMSLRL